MNQQLGAVLGYGGAPPRALGADLGWLKEHLRGTNPRLPRADEMIKTTPRTSNGCTARSAARCWAASPPRAWVRAAERGAPAPFAELEADNRAVLADVRAALDGRERDWAAYHRTTVAMHRANATAWAGVDRIAQIDPDFVPD